MADLSRYDIKTLNEMSEWRNLSRSRREDIYRAICWRHGSVLDKWFDTAEATPEQLDALFWGAVTLKRIGNGSIRGETFRNDMDGA